MAACTARTIVRRPQPRQALHQILPRDIVCAGTAGAPQPAKISALSFRFARAPHSNAAGQRRAVTVTKTSATATLDVPPTAQAPSSPSPVASVQESESEEIPVTITQSCQNQILKLAKTKPNPEKVYLRLYVDAGGCSGFQYKFELENEDGPDHDHAIDSEEDVVFKTPSGARVVVDDASLALLRGSTIDYVTEMIRSSFAVVENPMSESACGCGSSFAVKNFEKNPALD